MSDRSRLARLKSSVLVLAVVVALAIVPSLHTLPALAQVAEQSPAAGYFFTVRPGDSWTSVARQTGVDVDALKNANPDAQRDNEWLVEGEALFIPVQVQSGEAVTTHVVKAGESWAGIAFKYGIPVSLLQSANPRSVRPSGVLYRGERLVIPPAPAAGEEPATPAATPSPAATEAAAPETPPAATETPEAEATATAEVTATLAITATSGVTATAPVTTTAPAAAGPVECPADFADFPELLVAIINSADGIDGVLAFLDDCDAAMEDGAVIADLTGDDQDDLVVVYTNPNAESMFVESDLMVFDSGEEGFSVGHRARAAGEVRLLATEDVNADGRVDVVWTDTTCGASTCFDTVNVRSWDGEAWLDWTEGTVTMAYAEIDIQDESDQGQGSEIVLSGGIYGSVGAGPQRGRVEVWASIEGEPYSLLTKVYNDSDCLYHTVLDANRDFLRGPGEGFAAAEALYNQATIDESLIKCWVRAGELEELRSFSLFRLALIAGYQGDAELAAARIGELDATYADSIYSEVGQAWLAEFQDSQDAAAACEAVTEFVETAPEAWQALADYGYTNPTFAAQDVCPVLDLGVAPEATPPAEEAPASDTEAAPEARATASTLPECPDDLGGYPEALPQVLTASADDPLAAEAWLRLCEAMADDRGGLSMADIDGDGLDDAVFFPTIISDLGFGPGGAQGSVLIYHALADGGYELAAMPDVYGQPAPLAIEDLNDDGRMDVAWTVVGCAGFCVLEAQMLSWDGSAYVPAIEPGATIAEGTATFEALAVDSVGQGQQLVLAGGVSGVAEGGLEVPHTEIWQSVDGAPYQRISWTYDREADGNDCLGLRLVEADVALRAASVLGYGPAVDAYTAALSPELQACSIFGVPAEQELILLQGLASFRLVQAMALSGDVEGAAEMVDALSAGQPDGAYAQAAEQWLSEYVSSSDAAAACATVQPLFEENADLWQITDHFGINHPALAAEQVCYVP